MTTILPIAFEKVSLRDEGKILLDQVSFHLPKDCITVLLGPNGAGKSLLLKMAAGLIVPSSGSVLWAGKKAGKPNARRLGFVFQTPILLRRSVRGNLSHMLRSAGFSGADEKHRIDEALAFARLEAKADQSARLLSGGERQRLAIARALSTDPDFLFLDEPTANLDPASMQGIEMMVQQAKARGVGSLLVTHDAGQACRLADDIMFLGQGQLLGQGNVDFMLGPAAPSPVRSYLAGKLDVDGEVL